MDVVKKLSFDDTGGLVDNAAQSANMNALCDLRKALEELRHSTQQRSLDVVAAGKLRSDGGGDNDLRRLQRQFQAQKATFVNFDVKERFMAGLDAVQLDAQLQDAANGRREAQLEGAAEALRDLKDQNRQARAAMSATIQHIAELYQRVEATTALTGTQLDALHSELAAHEGRKPPAEPPLGPGPGEAECQALLHAELARAKQLESSIAAMEANCAELEVGLRTQTQDACSLRAEVERMEELHSDRARAADADSHYREAGEWCEAMVASISQLSGVTVLGVGEDSLRLQLRCCVPLARCSPAPVGAALPPPPQQREVLTEVTLVLAPGGVGVVGARLAPVAVAASDVVDAAHEVPPPRQLAFVVKGVAGAQVRSIHGRLLRHWQRQVLVEAAAERYALASSDTAQPLIRATVPLRSEPGKMEAEVVVPWEWPADARASLRVASVRGVRADVAAAAMECVNNDPRLTGAGLLELLAGLEAAANEGLLRPL